MKDPVKPEYWHGWREPNGYPEVVKARKLNRHSVVWFIGDETRAWRCCACGLMVRADDLENLGPVAKSKIFVSDSWQVDPTELQKVLWHSKWRTGQQSDSEHPAPTPAQREFEQAWGHINWQNPRLLPSEVDEN